MAKQIFALVVIITTLFGILFLVYSLTSNKNPTPVNTILDKNAFIYFYGNTCPHCQDLIKWMEESNIEDKVKIDKREVYNNRENATLLEQAALVCKLDTSSIGVPFIYDKGQCYIGVPEAKALLLKKSKAK